MYTPPSKYLAPLFLIILFTGCKKKTDSTLSEGRIEFDITYQDDRIGGYSSNLLPKQMNMEFKDNRTRNSIEGGLGFFNLVNVSDLNDSRIITYVKFIDRKYIYEGKRKEPTCCFGRLEGMRLEFTDKTRVIAGFTCNHAIASFPDDGIKPFDIWYTHDIPLDNPNVNTPFSEVPGVMLEFDTLLGDISMHVVATKFKPVKIDETGFKPPGNYSPVTKFEMEKIIRALVD